MGATAGILDSHHLHPAIGRGKKMAGTSTTQDGMDRSAGTAMAARRTGTDWFTGSSWAHLIAADVLRYGPVSRTTLAGYHHLSQGTLSRIAKDLIARGVLRQTRDEARTDHVPPALAQAARTTLRMGRGRPQQNLVANTAASTFIGVNVRAESVRAACVDAGCSLGGGSIHTRGLPATDPDTVAETIRAVVRPCLADAARRRLPAPCLIGIGLGGHVEEDGTCGYAPFLHWDSPVDLAGLVTAGCGIPARLFNNVSSYMRYMQWFGEGRGLEDFAVVTIGAGVGYGLVSGGRVVEAPGSSYGLAGHVLVDPDGPRCFLHKGHRGCSQCLTDESLALEYSRMTGSERTFEQYARDTSDPHKAQAQNLRSLEGHRLGVLIGTIANLAMARRVFIGGESNWVLQGERETISTGIEDFRPSQAPKVPFTFLDEQDMPDKRWVLGAATEVIRQFVLGDEAQDAD
jgi:predicted NBD/HSP70 family sugar kinase